MSQFGSEGTVGIRFVTTGLKEAEQEFINFVNRAESRVAQIKFGGVTGSPTSTFGGVPGGVNAPAPPPIGAAIPQPAPSTPSGMSSGGFAWPYGSGFGPGLAAGAGSAHRFAQVQPPTAVQPLGQQPVATAVVPGALPPTVAAQMPLAIPPARGPTAAQIAAAQRPQKGFLGPPSSMGLFFNAMFGGWEIASALAATQRADVMASLATTPQGELQERLQGIRGASSGILGSIGAMGLNMLGIGPQQMEENILVEMRRLESWQGMRSARRELGFSRRLAAADTGLVGSEFDVREVEIERERAARMEAVTDPLTQARVRLGETRRVMHLRNRAPSGIVGAIGGSQTEAYFTQENVLTGGARNVLENEASRLEAEAARADADAERARADNARDRQRFFASNRARIAGAAIETNLANALAGGLDFAGQRAAMRAAIQQRTGLAATLEAGRGGFFAGGNVGFINPMVMSQLEQGQAELRTFDIETAGLFNQQQSSAYQLRAQVLGQQRVTDALLRHDPLSARLEQIRTERDTALAGLPAFLGPGGLPSPMALEIISDAQKKEKYANMRDADQRRVMDIQIMGEREQLQYALREGKSASPFVMRAIGISSSGRAQAEQLRQDNFGKQAQDVLENAEMNVQLQRQNYLNQFRAVSFSPVFDAVNQGSTADIGKVLADIQHELVRLAEEIRSHLGGGQ